MLKNIENIMYIRKEFPSINEYFMLEVKDKENLLKYIDYVGTPEIKKIDDNIALEFIDSLLRVVNNWKSEYINSDNITDGVEWNLQIQYKNGYKKSYSGINDFPINFGTLDKVKRELIDRLRG